MDTPTKFCHPGFFGGRNAQRQRRSQRLNRLFYPGFEHLNGCAAGFETTLIEHNPIAFGHDVSFDWALKFTDISINCCNHAGTLKTPGSGSMTAIATVRQLSSLFRQQAAGRRCHHRRTNTKLIGAIVARAAGPSFLLIFFRRVPALVSLLIWRDRARGVTAQTEGERLVRPRGRWLASLLYRLPPFRKERGKMGHPSFVCDSGIQPCARE